MTAAVVTQRQVHALQQQQRALLVEILPEEVVSVSGEEDEKHKHADGLPRGYACKDTWEHACVCRQQSAW